MSKKIAIHWFRQDLRLADNPALYQVSQADETITIFKLGSVHKNSFSVAK
nr:deoxyribodipyrimidine photo-lyase [Francisella tularensis]